MRVSPKHIGAIKEAINELNLPNDTELYLFGSRTDPNKRGGDIDLLLVVASETDASRLRHTKHQILPRLSQAAEEQRVDLTIALKSQLAIDPFLKTLKNKIPIQLRSSD
jgi:uncharacterized protein